MSSTYPFRLIQIDVDSQEDLHSDDSTASSQHASDADSAVSPDSSELAANGAPAHEPEVWDEGIADFNPLFGMIPEATPTAFSPERAGDVENGTFQFSGYMQAEHRKDLLRFSTAGSVDDGKSTLIGRLLYDTQSVYEDQVRSIEGKGTTAPGVLDLALLTDGLRAEREQGITIDVAYRYFSTARRKFIIADTPGHEQYTRNMATGASTASLAIVLIDARKGVLIQSRRHAYITALLGVPHLVVAVNKMDLVGYEERVFDAIRADFEAFFNRFGELRPRHLYFVPVSALTGDNVVEPTVAMPWYKGSSLLQLLETVPAIEARPEEPFRMAVQRVLRPDLDFRGFSGQIASGTIRPGDEVKVLPSLRTSRVRRIVTYTGDQPEAHAPQSITLTLEDELDIGRGDFLVSPTAAPELTNRFRASLVWMDQQPLELNRRYLLKHASRTVGAVVRELKYGLDMATLDQRAASALELNGIGMVEMESMQPLAVDLYTDNRITGSFVLIDPATNATAAAGMVREVLGALTPEWDDSAPSAQERAARWGHTGAHIHLTGSLALADQAERALFARGAFVLRLTGASAKTIVQLVAAGVLVLTHEVSERMDQVRIESADLSDVLDLPVPSADELLRLLSLHSILKGDSIR